MYNKVIAFNVGCGDCSILQDERNGMLIDYGGTEPKVSNVLLDVKRILSQLQEKNLMISHLHKDHYCGVQKLANNVTFKHIYLPNYICGDGLYILASSLLVGTDSIIKQVKEILAIPKIFLNNGLINYNSDIQLLVAGDTFVNSLGEFEVLLPNIYQSTLPESLIKKIYNNQIIRMFVKTYESLLNDLINYKRLDHIYEKHSQIKHYIKIIIEEVTELFSESEKYKIKEEFERYHNNMSVVFQNKEYTEKNILFCGDALAKEISKISNSLFNNYELIKIPHHGTDRKHYCDFFPSTNKFLLFNDSGTRCSKITCKYDNKYGLNTRFYCTNRNCYKVKCQCICNSFYCKNAVCGFINNFEIINL